MRRSDEILSSVKFGAPKCLPHVEAIFRRKPFRTLAKASENCASNEEFEELRPSVSELRVLIAGLQEPSPVVCPSFGDSGSQQVL